MQRLEVSGAVRPLKGSLDVKGLRTGSLPKSVSICEEAHTFTETAWQ